MDHSGRKLPDMLTGLLKPQHLSDGELAAMFAETLTSLSIFKQLNTTDHEIAEFCSRKGWCVLGFDYLSPPTLDEFMGRPPAVDLAHRAPLTNDARPHAIWNAWLDLGHALSRELNSQMLGETMTALGRWPIMREANTRQSESNVIRFKPRATPRS